MTTLELITPAEQETGAVLEWRFAQLRRSGYAAADAFALAARADVDLHRAADLLTSGCPASLALRILL